jgi:hypothetical protein
LIEETLKNSLARWLKTSSLALDGVLGEAKPKLGGDHGETSTGEWISIADAEIHGGKRA